jgi:hypothetical protein
MARAERDLVVAEEWFAVDERARARSVSFTQCREGMAPRRPATPLEGAGTASGVDGKSAVFSKNPIQTA